LPLFGGASFVDDNVIVVVDVPAPEVDASADATASVVMKIATMATFDHRQTNDGLLLLVIFIVFVAVLVEKG
jgi:hypothetical protein